MKQALLTSEELEKALGRLEPWQLSQNTLKRKITFSSFADAFAFMTNVALAAEKMDHHPDWSNSYTKISISLTTHSSGGITQLDIDLAEYINTLT